MVVILWMVIFCLVGTLVAVIKGNTEAREISETEEKRLLDHLTSSVSRYSALEQGRDEMEEGYQQMILDHQEQLQIKIVQVSIRDDIIRAQDEELEMRKIEISNLEAVKEQQLKKIQALEKAINEALTVHDNLRERIKSLEKVMSQRHWSLDEG